MGWILLALASVVHMIASLDLLRQRAFPSFPRGTALAAAIVVIAVTVYLPISAVLMLCALPTHSNSSSEVGYLVNRLAYLANPPAQGHWIWLSPSSADLPRAGWVVAVAGQEVEWMGKRWLVDGKELVNPPLGMFPRYPDGWRFRVPENHVVVGPDTYRTQKEAASPLVIVCRDRIVGRAWARYYPVWDRCLL
jgi:hypothetical protein